MCKIGCPTFYFRKNVLVQRELLDGLFNVCVDAHLVVLVSAQGLGHELHVFNVVPFARLPKF